MDRAHTGELVAGRYRLVRQLGRGGMGTVYLAHDERLDRPVALKRMHAGAPEEIARRFEREARLGAALDHPNLVAVYDVARDDGSIAIAMEFVDGEALADVLARRELTPAETMLVVRGVAAALDHAHARGVVHRDVKPGNVLLGPHGVKVADLGISTAADATRITMAGSLLGTAAYMAPEQLAGGEVGPAADVHALGLVAYEMLAGVPARAGETPMELLHAVMTQPPPDVRHVRPSLPEGAAAALQRALAVDPLARQPSAGQLAAELGSALAAAPPPSTPPPPPAPPPAHRPRRTGVLAGLALLALAAVALAAGLLLPGGDSDGGDGSDRATATATATASEPPPAPPTTARPVDVAESMGPAETVRAFYERGAAGDIGGAWALLNADGQRVMRSEQTLANTFSTLQSVAFSQLEASVSGDAASVAITDAASHATFTDHCTGTITLRRSAGAWRISGFAVACDRG